MLILRLQGLNLKPKQMPNSIFAGLEMKLNKQGKVDWHLQHMCHSVGRNATHWRRVQLAQTTVDSNP
jgi:hypothetical protein